MYSVVLISDNTLKMDFDVYTKLARPYISAWKEIGEFKTFTNYLKTIYARSWRRTHITFWKIYDHIAALLSRMKNIYYTLCSYVRECVSCIASPKWYTNHVSEPFLAIIFIWIQHSTGCVLLYVQHTPLPFRRRVRIVVD